MSHYSFLLFSSFSQSITPIDLSHCARINIWNTSKKWKEFLTRYRQLFSRNNIALAIQIKLQQFYIDQEISNNLMIIKRSKCKITIKISKKKNDLIHAIFHPMKQWLQSKLRVNLLLFHKWLTSFRNPPMNMNYSRWYKTGKTRCLEEALRREPIKRIFSVRWFQSAYKRK